PASPAWSRSATMDRRLQVSAHLPRCRKPARRAEPMRHRVRIALIVTGLLCPSLALAQGETGGPDPAKVRVRLGALWMNPSISLSNLGIDQNVFNDPPERQPKEDFTVTIAPKIDLWVRMGRSWLSGSIDEQFVWFQTYSSERSANNRY